MILRPVRDTAADAAAVREISTAAFPSPAVSRGPHAGPPDERAAVRQDARTRHLVRTDPAGCWLAEDNGRPLGVALSMRREGLWCLGLFAVVPDAQGKGLGRALLERAAVHGRSCLRGMLCASPDPAAARRYRHAGFTLHPAMELHGTVDRSGLPDPGDIPVHQGNASHQHLLDSVDRQRRGAAHGPDHAWLLRHTEELLVADTLAGTGYCYRDGGQIKLLAATSRRLAVRLLREALARIPEGVEAAVHNLTAEQEWAVDVGLEAGLALSTRGYVGLRGMRPPAPYIPSGGFL